MKTLKIAGEFGFIASLKKYCAGLGDDTAVLSGGKKDILFTTDMLIEGRHFLLNKASPFEIGWKAMAVNLSDIAAMGGSPRWAVVSLGAPGATPVKLLEGIYRGMDAAAQRFGAHIVGGDTNRNERLVLSVALLGEAEKGKAVRRSGAKPGDWVFVTGRLGNSYRSKKHLRFIPRLREARWLSDNFRLHAMMDLSDGLASDIRRLCAESRVGAVLSEGPIPRAEGASVLQALGDGEDFELLFTLPASEAVRLSRKKAPAGFPRFSHVGWIVKGSRIEWLRKNGRLETLALRGFDHFR